MIPVLYPSTETAFENNGLGGLPDSINCIVTEQRNTQGGYWLEMDYPIDGLHYADIAPERIIYAAPSMGNTPQPFRISRITRPINGIVHIEAPHLCAELQKLTSWGVDTGTNIQGMIYNQFYRARQLGQTVPFWCETDITVESDVTFSHPEPTSLADILLGAEGSVLDVVGGEYEWDGYHIILHRQRGVDSGLEIRYGVNMSDLEAETDATELVTAVVPYWKGTVNEVDTVVIGDMCSASNASAYAYVRCVPLDVSQQFEETDTQPTKADVTAKGQAFINSTSRKLLQTSIRVSYEPTTSGIGERRINLCDTVRVVYPDLNVSSISKVVETRFNVLTERYDELTIGTIRNNIVDTIAGLISGGTITGGGGSSGGGGGSAVGAVLYNMPQSLNEAQKAQARSNIGVGSGGESVVNLPFVTPEDYGAVGDGVVDDTIAIQSALDSGETVVFNGDSTYLVSDSLQVHSRQIVNLNGSTIKQTVNLPVFIQVQTQTAVTRTVIKNGYILGTVTQTENTDFDNQCGIRITSYHSQYEDLRFDNLTYGIYMDTRSSGSGTLVENKFRNLKFVNCAEVGLFVYPDNKNTNGFLSDIICAGTYKRGIWVRSSAGWRCVNLNSYGTCTDIAIQFDSCDATILTGVHVDHFANRGLVLNRWGGAYLANAVIRCDYADCIGLFSSVSSSSSWTDRPLVMTNIEFRTNVETQDSIYAMRTWGAVQASNIYYQDEHGAFKANTEQPAVELWGYELPFPSSADKGKIATVDATGKWGMAFPGGKLRSHLFDDGTLYLTIASDEELPLIITQPIAPALCQVGASINLDIRAIGGDLSYQWKYRTPGGIIFNNSTQSGATTSSIVVRADADRNGQTYKCVVTDTNGNETETNAVTLIIDDGSGFGIRAHPSDQKVASGEIAVFNVTAVGNGLTYQWQYRGASGGNWQDSGMDGATTASVSVQATDARNGQYYRCVVTDSSENTQTSNVARLEVY